MGKKKGTQKSIAINLTHRTSIIFFAALIFLLLSTYLIISNIVRKNTEKTSEQMVMMLANDIKNESAEAGVPISVEYPEISIMNGDYLCEYLDIDYAFVIEPNPGENQFTYISISCKDKQREKEFPNHSIGVVQEAEYSRQELDLWDGKITYSHIIKNKHFGHEMVTETIIEDTFGNRVSVGVDVNNGEIYATINRYFILIGILLILVMISIYLGLYMVVRRQVSVPAMKLSEAMTNFVADRKHVKLSLSELKCSEYEMIAGSFDSMRENIDEYVNNIETLTRDSERQRTELDIASRIQHGFLPKGEYSSESFSISAVMKPAKEVAGDLYDYLELDDKHVLIVIADVSGKGFAASLFMAITLILIRQYARFGLTPDKILERTNAALILNNPLLLFVTAFVGIYDRETGTLAYANAGHCIPYIAGDKIRKLSGETGVILGVYEGEEYSCAEEIISSGETLVLYTDGVSEAMNKDKEMFGEMRIEEVLTSYRESGSSDIIGCISDAIADFTAGCEQHDDITMLSLTRK